MSSVPTSPLENEGRSSPQLEFGRSISVDMDILRTFLAAVREDSDLSIFDGSSKVIPNFLYPFALDKLKGDRGFL